MHEVREQGVKDVRKRHAALRARLLMCSSELEATANRHGESMPSHDFTTSWTT